MIKYKQVKNSEHERTSDKIIFPHPHYAVSPFDLAKLYNAAA